MTRFNDLNLFAAGPHDIHVGGLKLRHVLHDIPSSRGVSLVTQGVSDRLIRIAGQLLADTPPQLKQLTDAIEAQLDGVAHELADGTGRAWPQAVMLSFDPRVVERVGPRYRIGYEVQFLVLSP